MIRKYAVVLLLFAAAGCVSSPEGNSRSAKPPSRPASARPAWVKDGIVMVGNWEPLTFIHRRGGQSIEDVENWPLERTEEVARKLHEAGVTLVVTNLHKGFGVKTEAADIEATRLFTAYAHRHGVRVGGYIGASMMYETFFAEEPDAKDWMQVDEWGRPIYYTRDQTFRYMACRNNPGYQAFIERLLRLGIQDVKLDLIHFDQMEYWPEPRSCRCRYCRERFRQFVITRYPAGKRIPRFGFERLDAIAPPPFDIAENHSPVRLASLKNPLLQEWALFRVASTSRHYAEYDDSIYALNLQVALEGNPNIDMTSNCGFAHGVDPAELLAHGDIVWSENPHHARWTSDGRLISKIRDFKAARIMGKSIFMYTGGRYGTQDPASPPHLRLAEAMAFNDMNLGMVGDVAPDGVRLTPEARRYIDFFHRHREVLKDTVPVSRVAVLRSFASTEFNPSRSLPDTVLFEQALIQNQIPFDIVFDRHLANLSRYRVLVLANQNALSDVQLAQIRAFVERGGGLVATGDSSLHTEWLLERRKFGLADVFGVDRPEKALRHAFGKGRVAYVPRIQAAMEPPAPQMSYSFGDEYWKLPLNSGELVESVVWAGGNRVVKAPPHVAVEVAEQRGTGRLLLHLVNYNFSHSLQNLEAAVPVPSGCTVREAVIETPDGAGSAVEAVSVKDGVARFRVPRLKVYDLVRLKLEKTGE